MIVHSMAWTLVVPYTSSWLELRQLAYSGKETLKISNAVSLTAGALKGCCHQKLERRKILNTIYMIHLS